MTNAKKINNHDAEERIKSISSAMESLRVYHCWTRRELRSVVLQLIDKVTAKTETSFTINEEGVPVWANDDYTTGGR